jgi:hypothetical protein
MLVLIHFVQSEFKYVYRCLYICVNVYDHANVCVYINNDICIYIGTLSVLRFIESAEGWTDSFCSIWLYEHTCLYYVWKFVYIRLNVYKNKHIYAYICISISIDTYYDSDL